MNKNYEISLIPTSHSEPRRALAPALKLLRLAATAVIVCGALLVFGPLWIYHGIRRGLGKSY